MCQLLLTLADGVAFTISPLARLLNGKFRERGSSMYGLPT